MSTINFHPLQTHSRFFRPWETQRQTPPPPARSAKRELESGTDRVSIKTKLPAANDRKSSSSSSAYSSSSTPLNATSQPALAASSQHLPTSNIDVATTSASAAFATNRYMAVKPEKFKCPHCASVFLNMSSLNAHIRIHPAKRSLICDVENCGKRFRRSYRLIEHKRIHLPRKPFCCRECGEKFRRCDILDNDKKTTCKVLTSLRNVFHPFKSILFEDWPN